MIEPTPIDKYRRRATWTLTPENPVGEPVAIPDNLKSTFVQLVSEGDGSVESRVSVGLSADGEHYVIGAAGGVQAVRLPVPIGDTNGTFVDAVGMALQPTLTDGDDTVRVTILFQENH